MPTDGWNALDGVYAFRYVDADGKRAPLIVKVYKGFPSTET